MKKFQPNTEGEWQELRDAAYYNVCDRCLSSKNLSVYHTTGLPRMLCDDCANGAASGDVYGALFGLGMIVVMILSVLFS